jgi:Ca2+-transporting ATPase
VSLQDDSDLGLSDAEALTRLQSNGENMIPSEAPKTLLKQVIIVLSEPMLILLFAAGAINFLLAEFLDAAMLMVTVFIVLGISIYQSRRAENALHALKELSAPTVKVIRDGVEKRISSHHLVVGDVILLAEGDRVCADAKLIEAVSLACDESTVTGESAPVDKFKDDLVLSGTLTTRGHGKAVVIATGINSQLGKIGKSLLEISTERSRLQKDVDQIVRVIGVLGVITVFLVVTIYGSTRDNWLEGGLAGIAAAMALIPEEFPVILTLFMAIGAWRMSKARVIARQPSAIEALGSISVLCVDKTGTITENHMTVRELIIGEKHFNIEIDQLDSKALELIKIAALAGPIRSFDPMDNAFKKINSGENSEIRTSIAEHPLSETRLAYLHIWSINNDFMIAAKGAPETISKMCDLDSKQQAEIMLQVHEAASRGFRVLAVAVSVPNDSSSALAISDQTAFTFLGLALLQDPIRPGVKESVAECRSAGIKTVMITGDHPSTARAIGEEIGLENVDDYMTGEMLNELSDAALAEKISMVSIFARVRPEHKLRIIRALQNNGQVVGMTGDGVNDAPALRAADIGLAMSGRGTDVAREAASLVITDDNFNSIVQGIKRGRVTYDNLQKAMSYVIAIHVPIFGLALLPIFSTNWPLILLPGLVAFHEVIIDPACSVVFEEESPDPNVMKEPPRDATSRVFSRREILLSALQGLSVFGVLFLLFLFLTNNSRDEAEIRSMIFGSLMMSNILLILTNRSRTLTIFATFKERSNPTIKWILGVAVLILISLISLPPLRVLFDLGAIKVSDWLLMFLCAFMSLAWYELYKWFRYRKLFSQ